MQEDLQKTIYDLETKLLKPEIRSSAKDLDFLIADDFIEFGSSGEVYDKKMILERLPKDTEISPVKFIVSDFQIKELNENIVLATFKTDKISLDNSHVLSLRASIWRKRSGNWQMIYHQGTPTK
jgi:hypothetical protein